MPFKLLPRQKTPLLQRRSLTSCGLLDRVSEVAMGGVIFQSQLQAKLIEYPTLADRASTYSKDASSLVQILKAMPEGSPERIMIVNAYAESLKVVWATMAGLAFVAMVCSARVEGLSMDGGLSTEQGLRHTGKSGSENEGTIDHGAINTNVV